MNKELIPRPEIPQRDPRNINGRLYAQIDALLTQLETGEHITLKERIAAMIAVARIQVAFVGLRKEKVPDDVVAGSTVRKYATAFANDTRRRAKGARPVAVPARPEPEPDDDLGLDLDDDNGDDAA